MRNLFEITGEITNIKNKMMCNQLNYHINMFPDEEMTNKHIEEMKSLNVKKSILIEELLTVAEWEKGQASTEKRDLTLKTAQCITSLQ